MAQASHAARSDKPLLVLLPGLLCDAALFAPQVAAVNAALRDWLTTG
jgi:hypothetical protein